MVLTKIAKFTFSVFFFSLFMFAGAQTGLEEGSRYGSGEDSVRCIKNLSLYRTYARQNNFEYAHKFWHIPFNECPRSSQNLYIDGVRIYKHLIDNEEDEALKQRYVDTLAMIYDQRIEYFGSRGNLLGRKGVDVLSYRGTSVEGVRQAYEALGESVEIQGTESGASVLAAYVSSSVFLYRADEIDADQVIDDYVIALGFVEELLYRDPDDRRAQRAKEMVDEAFLNSGAGNCEALDNIFPQKLTENPEDKSLLVNMTTMYRNICPESEHYFSSSEKLHAIDPSPRSASEIARMAVQIEEYEKAVQYYKEAIELESDKSRKARYFVQMADITNKIFENHAQARDYALKAIQEDEDIAGRAYMVIGDIYANTTCGENELQKAAVYWLAVDYFNKAKQHDEYLTEEANQKIAFYSAKFPDSETIFFHGYEEGQSYRVGCWINESTRVRIRR